MYYKNNQKCFENGQNHQRQTNGMLFDKVSLLNTEEIRLGQLEVYEVKTAGAKLKIQNK